ncbi:MAG: class I SAM-dependent methyltransferase [Thermoleophilaceae bacterium]|nr:class I SAM-dependent methyltransferase [Thermoleophilaceae bacterium]
MTPPPLPPDELIDRVTPGVAEATAETNRADFRTSGRQSVQDLEHALAAIDRRLDSYGRILEFGCGCGRIMVWLEPLAARCSLHGTDIDEAAIQWCRKNLPFAEFGVNPHEPPMQYGDAMFDLVYNHSVLTHLDERHQDVWMAELRRITKPGGTVLLTVHGEQVFEDNEIAMAGAGEDPRRWREQLESDGILFVEQDSYTGSAHPDFYHTTFHAPWYVFEHWGRFFSIRAYLPRAALSFQDIVVLERPDDDPPRPRPVAARPAKEAFGGPGPAADGETNLMARVEAELTREIAPRYASRFGRPGELARRVLLRLMRPYILIERDLDRELAGAIADTRRQLRMPPLVKDVLDRHSERMKRLEGDLRVELVRLADRLDRVERRGSNDG